MTSQTRKPFNPRDNPVHAFWKLWLSQRREIMLELGIPLEEIHGDPNERDFDRYKRLFIKVKDMGRVDELVDKIVETYESTHGKES